MEFSLLEFCEPLMDHPSYFTKRMFGGMAVYYQDLMVFVLTEKEGDREWKNKTFDFDLWNGVLLCTDHIHQDALKKKFNGLVKHPILGKWLYLPMSHRDFEYQFSEIVTSVQEGLPEIGIVPGSNK